MIDLRNHYGFTRTPFGKDLAPAMLHHYPAHAEAVARITWCARERALAVITGEVGAGKTISARAAIAGLDQTRHTLIYLADPTTGTRGIHHTVVTALGGRPAHGSATLAAQAAALIAAEHGERGRVPLLVIDEAHLLGHHQLEAVRILTNWSTPGLVETRFSPDALVWVAVVFHGTAAWRNHGLIIFPLLFYRTSVQLRCPAAPPGGGLRPSGRPPGLGHLLVGHLGFAPRVPRAGRG